MKQKLMKLIANGNFQKPLTELAKKTDVEVLQKYWSEQVAIEKEMVKNKQQYTDKEAEAMQITRTVFIHSLIAKVNETFL